MKDKQASRSMTERIRWGRVELQRLRLLVESQAVEIRSLNRQIDLLIDRSIRCPPCELVNRDIAITPLTGSSASITNEHYELSDPPTP